MLLGGVAWIGAHELDPAQADRVATRSRSRSRSSRSTGNGCSSIPTRASRASTSWSFPAGVPLHFELTSASVMNAFFVPQLGSMIYTMNGMATQLNLQADEPGTFQGLSAHFSGDGFSDMHFDVHVVPPDEFADWVDAARERGPSARRRELCRAGQAERCKVAPFDLSAGRSRTCSTRSSRRNCRPAPGLQAGVNRSASPRAGDSRCSASSAGTRFRSTSRSR